MSAIAQPPGLERLLAAKEIVITCGAGGVGKTTTAAALGLLAARRLDGRVLVLTVDPARRLANALGIEAFGNVERKVELGAGARGELWAAMLDTKQSWDDLVCQYAPDTTTREAILANPLYANITAKFVQSHDYIAMERLYEIHHSGRFDLVIVDTPPSRNALDFLDAPARMSEFFGGRLLRWLTVPARSRLFMAASKPFYQVADRVLGSQFLQDIAEFFVLFQSMERGFVERARTVAGLLADRRTTFIVVSTLEASPAREAEFFLEALTTRRLHLGALVLNKVLPAHFVDQGAAAAAATMGARAAELAHGPLAALDGLADPAQTARVLASVAETFANYQVAATREAEERVELALAPDVTVAVPYLDTDVCDVASLNALADLLAVG